MPKPHNITWKSLAIIVVIFLILQTVSMVDLSCLLSNKPIKIQKLKDVKKSCHEYL